MEKRGQEAIGMSFSTIFSIILMVVFITVAIFVIYKFIEYKRCTEIGLFIEDLGEEIETAWKSEKHVNTLERSLPGNLDYVCITNLSDNFKGTPGSIEETIYDEIDYYYEFEVSNLFFYPFENSCGLQHELENIDLGKITSAENPYCIPVDGKVEIEVSINRRNGETLVNLK